MVASTLCVKETCALAAIQKQETDAVGTQVNQMVQEMDVNPTLPPTVILFVRLAVQIVTHTNSVVATTEQTQLFAEIYGNQKVFQIHAHLKTKIWSTLLVFLFSFKLQGDVIIQFRKRHSKIQCHQHISL
jgi:hypothetical protein